MGLKIRVKSVLRFPATEKLATHKGYTRPYRRNIYGKLYLYYMNMGTRQRAERSGEIRFKDFIVAPYWKGPKGRRKKIWGVYVEADEFVRYMKRKKKGAA